MKVGADPTPSAAAAQSAAPGAWAHVLRVACALAAAMGVGRFVYTPILPLMTAQAGMSPAQGATLATVNYVGYFAGSLLGMVVSATGRSPALYRISLILVVGSMAAMPLTLAVDLWLALRFVAGVGSAVVFVFAVSSLLGHLRGHPGQMPGWGFSGVGAGIALAGVLVLIVGHVGDWRTAWWAAAALCALLTAGAWSLRPEATAAQDSSAPDPSHLRTHRWFSALFASYTLEGLGYMIAGTFLVAAVAETTSDWLGATAWILVGLAAAPSAVLWGRLGVRFSRPALLFAALIVQAVGIALPAVAGGATASILAALFFGVTFVAVSTLTLSTGAHLRFPRSVPLLTAGYSLGQIAGPVAVAPLLARGYHPALLVGAVLVLVAAAAAALLRIGFPHHLPVPHIVADPV